MSARTGTRRRRILSRRVRLIAYDHVDDPEGDDVTREHEFTSDGVELWALPDGSLLIKSPDGVLWGEER